MQRYAYVAHMEPTRASSNLSSRQSQEFFLDLNDESGRGKVLIAAGFIDQQLRDVLAAFMFNNKSATALLGVDAPLGSLNARIAACHALGLISDIEKHDLTILRKIRNEFAHHIEASFDLPKIRDLCRSLRMKAPEHVTEVMGKTGEFESSAIITTLANRPHYVGLQRRKVQDWPH